MGWGLTMTNNWGVPPSGAGPAPIGPFAANRGDDHDEVDAFVLASVFGAMNFIGIGENLDADTPKD